MKLKLFIFLAILLCYTTVTFTACKSSSLCRNNKSSICAMLGDNSTDTPHAVDISGKAIPPSSATQPDKPIILAKDSQDDIRGEFKPEAAFDHTKHSTDTKHSLDGMSITTCVECHHTAQPSAPAGQEYLKKFERKETLTAKQLETSKEPVQSCRTCHLQENAEETDEYPPVSVTYPKSTKKPPSGKLYNNIAYHINCNSCHSAVKKRDLSTKAPQNCEDCHSAKQ